MKKVIDLFKFWMARFVKFLQNWSEAWALIPAAILFLFLPTLLRLIDPTAGGYDIGYVAKFILSLVFMLAVSACVWIGIRYNHPTIFKYGDDNFDNDWNSLTSWQRMCIYLLVPAFLSLLFVVLIIVL